MTMVDACIKRYGVRELLLVLTIVVRADMSGYGCRYWVRFSGSTESSIVLGHLQSQQFLIALTAETILYGE